MVSPKDAQYFIDLLKLEPHREGGWFRQTWKSELDIPRELLPPRYDSKRHLATLIYFLLKSDEISQWHQVKSDEFWIYNYGGSLEITLGGNGERPIEEKSIIIGPKSFETEVAGLNQPSFQAEIPVNVWQTTKVIEGDFVLSSCLVSPGFEFQDFKLVD